MTRVADSPTIVQKGMNDCFWVVDVGSDYNCNYICLRHSVTATHSREEEASSD